MANRLNEPAEARPRRRRRGSVRRTLALYRKASTPEVLHRAHKTFWQGIYGGSATSVVVPAAFDLRIPWLTRALFTLGNAVLVAVDSYRTNILAAVDQLIAEQTEEIAQAKDV